MVNGEETSKVTLDTSLDGDELTMDELAQYFKELKSRYEILLLQNKSLKKKNKVLKNKLDIVFKEKNDLSICFEKIKKDFHDHKLVCKGKSPSIVFDKNKFLGIQKCIIVLDSTLK